MKIIRLGLLMICGLFLFCCCDWHSSNKTSVSRTLTEYTVIYPEEASDTMRNIAESIADAIESVGGTEVKLHDDSVGETEKEILVGNTNRSSKTGNKANAYEGRITTVDNKIEITGGGESGLSAAAEEFIEEYVTKGNSDKNPPCLDGKADKPVSALEGAVYLSGKNGDTLIFIRNKQGYTISAAINDQGSYKEICTSTPVCLKTVMTKASVSASEYISPYNTVSKKNGVITAEAEVTTEGGSVFRVFDIYKTAESGGFCFSRTVKVLKAGSEQGFSSVFSLNDASFIAAAKYEYFIPAVLYRDASYMEKDSVMGTVDTVAASYAKETRTGLPVVMLRNTGTNGTFYIQHLNPDISNNDPDTASRTVISKEINYGSLGYSFAAGASARFVYPSTEGPYTCELGKSWQYKYHPVSEGFSHSYDIAFRATESENYTDAMCTTYRTAYELESPKADTADLDKLYSDTIEIYNSLYLEFHGDDGSVSAGLPFGQHVTDKSLYYEEYFHMGFVGQQTSVAYAMLREGLKTGNAELKKKAVTMLDFWCSESIMGTTAPVTVWKPYEGDTAGIAYPEGYPSFLRNIADGMTGILKAYNTAVSYGEKHEEWLAALNKAGNWLLAIQEEDGSYCRAYSLDGSVFRNSSNPLIQGTSRLCTPEIIPFLADMYRLTGDTAYKNAALSAAEYSYERLYKGLGKYVGGTIDNPNICDKEAAIYALRGFIYAYKLSNEEKYLKAAEHAAVSVMSWVYVYDFKVTYAASDEYQELNSYRNGGVIGYSMVAVGCASAADSYAAVIYQDLFEIYLLTGEKDYLNYAVFIENAPRLAADTDGQKGYTFSGFAVEASNFADFHFYTNYKGIWLPWISVVFTDPMTKTEDMFGYFRIEDIIEKYSLEELRDKLLISDNVKGH